MPEASLTAISAEAVDADRAQSEAVLARAHRSAMLAVLIYFVECGLMGLAVWLLSKTAHDPDSLHLAPKQAATVGIAIAVISTVALIGSLIVVVWPVAGTPKVGDMAQYRTLLKEEDKGPAIADAYTFRQAVRYRQSAIKVAVGALMFLLGATILVTAAV